MRKFLFLLNYVGKGGTEKYVLDLIQAAGPENCVFIYSEKGPGLEDFIRIKVKIHQVSMSSPFDFKAARHLKKIIQAEKVEVVHAQFLRENYLALLAKLMGARCKVFWTYHVDVPMGKGVRSLNKFMTSFNTKVITVSKFMYQRLLNKGVAADKLQVIYNGVEGPKAEKPMTSLHDVPVISVVGRLREEKGQAFLIKSLKNLDQNLKWECHIFGEGPQEKELISLVKELQLESRVFFKGFCSDKESLYINSDIIVVPSSNEALSYVAMEGLSYNRIVVATNVGGLPEVVKDGETGLLVEYGDIEGLAGVLTELLNNQELVQRLSMNGRRFFEEHFTMEEMIKKTTEVYRQ